MKKSILNHLAITILCTGLISLSCSKKMDLQNIDNSSSNEVPEGWFYYDGDEFDGTEIDHRYWGIYGDEYTFSSRYGQPQGMLQTYRKQQISFVNDQGRKVVRITATRDDNPPTTQYEEAKHRPGWWSGGLSSRDAKNYNNNPRKLYPLFSRIEIKAKVPYEYGVWMSLWLRHYLGASTAELDILEIFYKYYQTTPNKMQINQTLHMHDSETNKLRTNVNKNPFTILDFNPADDYHVYGVQIDPDPNDPKKHAIISFLLDGKITNTWKTIDFGNKYNSFITRAMEEGMENTTWDVAITGQIGGLDRYGVGYPEDHNPNLRNVTMDIDWLRVYTRENKSK
ncbi:MAG: family 16 glycosylhydrolase [Capnocytophaga sp.]|nr:family 16 glycosylhydrolase [Capnocytophaga sp.]